MKIGFYNCFKEYNNNKMLTNPSSLIGDDLMYPFLRLARLLEDNGHSAATIDTDKLENFDAILFVEFPGKNNKYLKILKNSGFKNIYLIAMESPAIKPENYKRDNLKIFKKVFTWSDELIDNKKFFKINYSHNIPKEVNFPQKERKLCTIIAGNKQSIVPGELYSERIKAIRWFEKNYAGDFDLYGNGWDKKYFFGSLFGFNLLRLNRLSFITKAVAEKYPSYKGPVNSKNETLKKYKFSICYENFQGAEGYITEKIFDCFLAGCVPVYLGAPNIADHIPENTFIDKRKFKNYEELYVFLKNIPENEYKKYLDSIAQFLKSDFSDPFSAEYFARIIYNQITK